MTEHIPLVSIGMPVYNGERYLAEAIESLLAQDYQNMEIIICDNASIDTTPQICQQFQQQDSRIQYFQNKTNIGASNNFNRTFTLAKGEFFMWAAYDDLWDQTYIRKCVQKLKQHPEAIMCVTESEMIDEEGMIIGNGNEAIETINLSFSERLHQFFLNVGWIGSIVYGLYRVEYLKRTRLFLEEYGPDVILGLEMYLLGDVVKVDERLFSYRHFRDKTHYDQIASISANADKQSNIAQASHTQLIKNLYQVLKEGNVSSAILQDFFDVLVFQQRNWVRMSCMEHTALFQDRMIDPDYMYDFLKTVATTEKSPEQIVNRLESPALRFQQLSAERPIIILGSFEVGVMIWWKYLKEYHIPVQALVEESTAFSQSKLYEALVNTAELPVRPFVIIASQQPHIMEQQLEQRGYKHRADFLQVNMNIPFLYLI